ncbi:MAG: lysine--tRNA ligase [Candidatus Desantisbacteria bacterium]
MQIKELLNGFSEGKEAKARGRLISFRPHGGSGFGHIKDGTGRIQIYGKADKLSNFAEFLHLTLGDIIEVEGELFLTKTSEKTIFLSSFSILTKPQNPIPKEWYGIRDVEIRHRKRYLDLLVNEEVKERFEKRSKIISSLRRLLDEKGFLEVETPMMHAIAQGAEAEPFLTHHNALDLDLCLRIAPELYLKRLIVGGLDRVYEIGKTFRNEGVSTLHNPEFTILEAYLAYANYNDMMELSSCLISSVAKEILGQTKIIYNNNTIDLTSPWKKLSVFPAIGEAVGEEVKNLEDCARVCERLNIKEIEDPFKTLVDRFVQPNLIQPTFLVDFPAQLSPLAKKRADEPNIAERFEIIIAGCEIGNAYSELSDPDEQLENFKRQGKIDYDFVSALSYGLPPTGGLGIGIDRLVMLLTDQTSIREVILFPLLKPKDEEDFQGDI